jgi:hypothetical protein
MRQCKKGWRCLCVPTVDQRCWVRVVYDLGTKTFSFFRDADMRDDSRAASRFGMMPLPAHVPHAFRTMQDILYVYLAYIIGEARRGDKAPIRQFLEPVGARRLLRKQALQRKEWRVSHGLHEDDSDYDP